MAISKQQVVRREADGRLRSLQRKHLKNFEAIVHDREHDRVLKALGHRQPHKRLMHVHKRLLVCYYFLGCIYFVVGFKVGVDGEGLHAFESLAQRFDAHGADDVEVIIDDRVSYIVHEPFRHRDGLERDLVVYLLQDACPELEWFLFEVLDHLDDDALFGEPRLAVKDVE